MCVSTEGTSTLGVLRADLEFEEDFLERCVVVVKVRFGEVVVLRQLLQMKGRTREGTMGLGMACKAPRRATSRSDCIAVCPVMSCCLEANIR